MAGTSNGFFKANAVGGRVGTNKEIKMTYTPAHINAQGKKVNARLVIPILINEYGRSEPDSYRLIAWGKMADMFAKNLNKGKEMHFYLTGSSYWGDVYSHVDGVQMLDKDNRPLQTRQVSFIIRDFVWGSDGMDTLMDEINNGIATGEGRRPAQWNFPGTPDNQLWKQMLAARTNTFFSQAHLQAGVFGFARVRPPKGGGAILFGAQYEREAVINANGPAPAPPPPTAAPGYPGAAVIGNQGMPVDQAITNAFGPNAPQQCTKCQTQIPAGAGFCSVCGTQAAPAPVNAPVQGNAVYGAAGNHPGGAPADY